MDARIQSQFDALERDTTAFVTELERHSVAQLEFQPAPRGWSMLEVGQHLIIVEKALVDSSEGTQLRSLNWRSNLILGLITVSFRSGLRVPTLPPAVPRERRPLDDVRADWSDVRVNLRALLEPLEATALERSRFVHPVAGSISLRQGLEFMRTHIAHHRVQLERIRQSPGFPAG